MPCAQLTEILRGCDNNTGGLRAIYVTAFDNVSSVTEVAGEVTAITMATASFVTIEFTKNSSSFVEDAAIDLTNGSTFYTVNTSIMLARRDVDKRNAIMLLASGQQNLMVILLDQNGEYWLQGKVNGANLQAVSEGSGVAKADGSKYGLSIVSEEPELMPVIDSTIIAALL
jgi:hypothetical protein